MELGANNTAFGRHETFPLRYGWLTKGFHALKRNPKVFESDESTVILGVGKNMVGAIRYWLRATQMIMPNSTERTRLGDYLLSERKGKDPYLEDEATIWLIHWLFGLPQHLRTPS